MFGRHSGPGWIPTGILIYIPLYLIVYYTILRHKNTSQKITGSILLRYILLVFDVTQFPFPWGKEAQLHVLEAHRFRYNVKPLNNLYWNLWVDFQPRYLLENFLNVAIFVPIGFLMGRYLKDQNKPFIKTMVFVMAFTLTIELLQLAGMYYGFNVRIFDIDDLIMNTLGGLIGYGLWILVVRSRKLNKGK